MSSLPDGYLDPIVKAFRDQYLVTGRERISIKQLGEILMKVSYERIPIGFIDKNSSHI